MDNRYALIDRIAREQNGDDSARHVIMKGERHAVDQQDYLPDRLQRTLV
jgi:hypothetical protein